MARSRSEHGGRRKGSGRKPTGKPRKEPAAVRIAPDVALYLGATDNRSASVEGAVRASLGYRLWRLKQRGLFVRLPADAPAPECE